MGRHKKTPGGSAYIPKKIPALEGTADIISDADLLWEALLKRLSRISRAYGFSRLETPLVEDNYLYESFYKNSKIELAGLLPVSVSGRPAALRPSLLPSVLRCYYQYKIFDKQPLSKWHYSGWVSRAANGRDLSSDFQFGFELFGSFSHLSEAQLIGAVWELLQSLELKGAVLEINNIGAESCQRAYQETLKDFLSAKKYELCDNCNDSLQSRPLDVFRCGNLDCQAQLSEAPTILDFLDEDSHKHFTNILEALDELGIPYQLNPLYAGSAGHSKTNFVIKYKFKDQVRVIGEGGAHDDYMQSLCGKDYCSFGFVGSASLIRELLETAKISVCKDQKSDVFLVPLGELASKKSLRLFRDLIAQKISVYDHFGQSGVKNQLKQAQSFNAPIALIMGQKEAMDEMVILRDVKSGMQEIISYDKIVEEVKKRLGK
jgi:histidyl-tRNA synthetase